MSDSAWEKLGHREDRAIWEKVAKDLAFRPSIRPQDFPGFREPAPFVTYSFAKIWDTDFDQYEADLQAKAHRLFKDVTQADDYLYALDWQHTCYKFFPHKSGSEVWNVPALPDGDYYMFLEPALQFGWLGHPWEKTICIFGERLLKSLKHSCPKIFKHPVRQKEQRV